MIIPDDFETMPDNLADIKYPSLNRMPLILSDPTSTIDFRFDFDIPAEGSLEERVAHHKMILKRLHPSYVFFTRKFMDIEGKCRVACFDFRSQALDVDIYNLWFLIDLTNSGIFGGFSCSIELRDRWEPLVRQMIFTIKPLPQDKE
jgi:hypothetical protein